MCISCIGDVSPWTRADTVHCSSPTALARDRMDNLNRFIYRESFPIDLARRMREYIHQSQHLRSAKAQQELMTELPPSLQGEVSWTTNQAWLTSIAFLNGAEVREWRRAVPE